MPEDVTAADLRPDIRAELRSLSAVTADLVARRLVMATRLLEDDPEAAYQHALAAQRSVGRVGVVREAAGLAAYAAGHYAEALAELRAARRIAGSDAYLPVMADCERGLGRPEKALALAGSPAVERLDPAGRAEMRIVAAGARRDLGQPAAAVVTLQGPDLVPRRATPWTARLRYAYADALLAAGRREDALAWFRRTAAVDEAGDTDATERAEEIEGLVLVDLEDQADSTFEGLLARQPEGPPAGQGVEEPAAVVPDPATAPLFSEAPADPANPEDGDGPSGAGAAAASATASPERSG